jgi:hypothetical protein
LLTRPKVVHALVAPSSGALGLLVQVAEHGLVALLVDSSLGHLPECLEPTGLLRPSIVVGDHLLPKRAPGLGDKGGVMWGTGGCPDDVVTCMRDQAEPKVKGVLRRPGPVQVRSK